MFSKTIKQRNAAVRKRIFKRKPDFGFFVTKLKSHDNSFSCKNNWILDKISVLLCWLLDFAYVTLSCGEKTQNAVVY